MGGRHLTREAAPFFWPIYRKEYVWTVKPSPGPHPIEGSIPLLIIVRDMLGYALTAREAEKIIKRGYIKVDGVPRKNPKFPVGLMDVVEVERAGEIFRMLPFLRYPLVLVKIPKEEAGIKLGKVIGKRRIKGGKIQVTTHDGRNFLFASSEEAPRVYDTIVFKVPEQEVLDIISFDVGRYAIVTGGGGIGRHGFIREVKRLMPKKRSIVTIEGLDGSRAAAGIINVFVVGEKSPVIKLPEGWEDVVRRRRE